MIRKISSKRFTSFIRMEEESVTLRKLTKIKSYLERPPKVYELKDQKLVDTMPKARRSDFQKPRGHYLKKGMARRTNNPHDDDMEIATPNLINNNIWSIPESNPLDDIFPLYPTSTDFTAESDFDSKWCDLSASPHISRGG